MPRTPTPTPRALQIAVVGAGLAGLTLARALTDAGHRVRVFDKSRGPGGRCATRRSDAGPFDHGAPWAQVTHATFAAQLAADAARGAALRLDTGASTRAGNNALGNGPLTASDSSCASLWLGVPSMNAWVRQHADGLNVETDRAIAALQAVAEGSDRADGSGPEWALKTLDGAQVDAVFDRVLLALPAEQAAALLATASPPDQPCALTTALRGTTSDPCWTVMAAWPAALPMASNHWHRDNGGGPLASAHRQDGRPGRPEHAAGADRWVLHASAAWTRDHLDARPESVIERLCGALAEQAGARLARPSFAVAHRWRYAQVPTPLADPFGWDSARGLGACGDAWHGQAAGAQGLERAWLSARALAKAVA